MTLEQNPSPEGLWDELMATVKARDAGRFTDLCTRYADDIERAFSGWLKPGQAVLADEHALQGYMRTLQHVAQYLDQRLGRSGPWRTLTGQDGRDNPFDRWNAARAAIDQQLRQLDYTGALAGARELVADIQRVQGSGRDRYELIARGLLGQILQQNGQPQEAVSHLQWALERCREMDDEDGTYIYLRALYEADRDMGRPSAWLKPLAEHAQRCGRLEEAAWYRHLLRRFPEGEPLLRVVAVVEGRRFEVDDVEVSSGRIQFQFERNRQTLVPAKAWTERGQRYGAQGELEQAMACFVVAADADPHDPQCRYQHAFTAMLRNAPDTALPLYEEVERLAPGWFHSRTWRSLAERQLAGELPHEAIQLVRVLEDGGLQPEARFRLATEGLERWPRMPELYLAQGEALVALERSGAREAWKAGLEVSDSVPSTRSRLLLSLERYEEVVGLKGANLLASAMATLCLRRRT